MVFEFPSHSLRADSPLIVSFFLVKYTAGEIDSRIRGNGVTEMNGRQEEREPEISAWTSGDLCDPDRLPAQLGLSEQDIEGLRKSRLACLSSQKTRPYLRLADLDVRRFPAGCRLGSGDGGRDPEIEARRPPIWSSIGPHRVPGEGWERTSLWNPSQAVREGRQMNSYGPSAGQGKH